MASRRGMVRRAVDRPPWNKVYEDLPDTGDRPNAEAAASPKDGGFVVATRSRTSVAITSQAGNQFMKAYHIMTPFWAKERKGKKRRRKGLCSTQARREGGFAFAIQPHREVRPESGLSIYEIYDMKACRITTLFFGPGRGRGRR